MVDELKFNYIAPLGLATGFNQHSDWRVGSFVENNLNFRLVPAELDNARLSTHEMQRYRTYMDVCRYGPKYDIKRPTVCFTSPYPCLTNRFAGTPRILETVLEVDKFPLYVKESLDSMDAIIHASEWFLNVCKQNDIKTPMYYAPIAVDTDFWQPESARKGSGFDEDTFIFFSVGKAEYRKGHDITVDAFQRAFKAEKNVHLVIYDSSQIWGKTTINYLWEAGVSPCKNVDFITPQGMAGRNLFMPEEMRVLFGSAKAFVWGTRCEGVGIPLLQAMSMAKPCITPIHSGITSFATPDIVFKVECQGKRAAKDPAQPLFEEAAVEWDEPMVESMAQQMRAVYDNYDAATKIGERARERLVSEFNLKKSGEKYAEVLKKIIEK